MHSYGINEWPWRWATAPHDNRSDRRQESLALELQGGPYPVDCGWPVFVADMMEVGRRRDRTVLAFLKSEVLRPADFTL